METFMSYFASQKVSRRLLEMFSPMDTWSGHGEVQSYLNFIRSCENVGIFNELESRIGQGMPGLSLVNNFLTEKHMEGCLIEGPIGDQDLVAAVYMLIQSQWRTPGELIYKLEAGKRKAYAQNPGIVLIEPETGERIGLLELENGDRVIFENLSSKTNTPFQLEANGANLSKDLQSMRVDNDYTGVIFPHINLDLTREYVEELIGAMAPTGGLSQVRAQLKLQLNHVGAKVEVAMSAVFEKCVRMPQYLIFDGEFAIHFVRGNEVYLSTFVTEEHFQEVEIDFN
jgi:hypothetical protein